MHATDEEPREPELRPGPPWVMEDMIASEAALPGEIAATPGAGALGGMLEFSRRFHGFAELGRVRAWHQGYLSTRADLNRRAQYLEHDGNYLALGITAYFGK